MIKRQKASVRVSSENVQSWDRWPLVWFDLSCLDSDLFQHRCQSNFVFDYTAVPL